MVPTEEQRRDYPAYALERIHELARAGRVAFAGRRVEVSIRSLDYGLDDICDCLASLQANDFKESILYPSNDRWLDVYLTPYTHRDRRRPDPLYVKLRLGPNFICIHLHSFHLEGTFQ